MTKNFSYVRDSHTYIFNSDDKCLYKLDKNTIHSKYYHCIERGCKSRAIIRNDIFNNMDALHNHNDHHEKKFELDAAYSKMKRLVVIDIRRHIRDIYNEVQRSLSFDLCGELEWKHVRHSLQRMRRSKLPPCPDLTTLIKLLENEEIFEIFGKIRNTDFYQGSVFDGQEKGIVFANLELISKLPERLEIFCDGTFSVTPIKAAQLLVILANFDGKPRPICYIIMTNRRCSLYEIIFKFLRDGIFSKDGILRNPILAMTDYEKSMRNALLKVWPLLDLRGCMFHYCQALRRKARSLKSLSTKVFNGSLHHQCLMMIMRLALVPLDRVDFAYEQVKEYIQSNPQVSRDFADFLVYFEKIWFNRYKPEEWVVSDLKFRSNNHLEGINRSIKSKMPRNPHPYKFLDVLLDFAYDSSASYQSFINKRSKQQIDRSNLSAPLKIALNLLENCEITELEFIQRMSQQTFTG